MERQPRLDIDGQPDHVHWFLGRFHRAHMLRVHVVQSVERQGPRPREPIRVGVADHPRRDQHDSRRLGPDPRRKLHIHGVFQDDLPGHRVRCAARYVPVARTPVAVRPGRVQLRQKTAFVHRQIAAAPVLHTAPVASPGLQQNKIVPRRVDGGRRAQVQLQPETGQGRGPGHVGGFQREQFVQVAEEEKRSGGRRGTKEEIHGGLEEGHGPFDDATAENGLPKHGLFQ